MSPISKSNGSTPIKFTPHFLAEDIRMHLLKILTTSCAVMSLTLPVWAQSTKYDFDYRSTDQRVQVFDDGKVTRVQLPEGTPEPTIVAVEPKGEVLLKLTKEHPHLLIEGIYSRLIMRWGNSREVQAVYGGNTAKDKRTGSGASFGSMGPQATFGTVGKPIDVVRSAPVNSANEPVAQSRMEMAKASAMAGEGTVATVVSATNSMKRFTFLATDKTVEGSFARWADEFKSGKKVVWRAGKPPLDALGDFEAEDVVKAMTLVAQAFEKSSNPFVVEEYDNVFLVVSKISARLQSK
jgi:hypothetical protein